MTMITEREMKRRQMQVMEARRRRVMRNRRILFTVTILIIGIIIGSITLHIKNAGAEEPEQEVIEEIKDPVVLVEYVHEVKGGENLSYIARKYIEQYNSEDSVEAVVSRIIWFNHLDETESNYHLQPGDKLVVPIFIPEDRNPHHADPSSTCSFEKESQN